MTSFCFIKGNGSESVNFTKVTQFSAHSYKEPHAVFSLSLLISMSEETLYLVNYRKSLLTEDKVIIYSTKLFTSKKKEAEGL